MMNFELSKINPMFRAALGLGPEDEAAQWASSPQRNLETAFAVARALVVVGLLTVSSDPSMADTQRFGLLSPTILVAIYALYSAGMVLTFVMMDHRPTPLLIAVVHIADIFWAAVFVAASHNLRTGILLVVFPMLAAIVRWGPAATLATTLAMVGIIEVSIRTATIGSDLRTHLMTFQISATVILLGVLFAHIGQRHSQVSRSAKAQQPEEEVLSGTPSQIVQFTFERAFSVFQAKHMQLLVEECNTGRTFLWHADASDEPNALIHSEEFDNSSADPYLRLMPTGDWVLQRNNVKEPLLLLDVPGKSRIVRERIPEVFAEYFADYTTVVSVDVSLGDEWQGRFVLCDPARKQPHRAALEGLRGFCEMSARSIHTAHLCLRACRDSAAEERARLARELHDGVIQSLLGVDLQLESLKRRADLPQETYDDLYSVQDVLRREAKGLRQLVNDSRRRALRPDRLLEYLSDLLERFQRDSGVVTRFFADLDSDPMPPRICYEIARIAEEAIINAQKHSRACMLTVRLGCVSGNWVLIIVDDGVGFEFRGVWTLDKLISAGFGPRVIKERVQSLNAELIIESTPTGARMEIAIPKNNDSRNTGRLNRERTLTSEATPKIVEARECPVQY